MYAQAYIDSELHSPEGKREQFQCIRKHILIVAHDLLDDVGMTNIKILKGVVKDYINLTKDGNSVEMKMAVAVEIGETIVFPIFCIF